MAGFVTGLRHRSHQAELLDTEIVSEKVLARAYRELAWINRALGYTHCVIKLLRQDVVPGSQLRVLDVGCGQGALLVAIRDALDVQVIGVDLRPVPGHSPSSNSGGGCGQRTPTGGGRCGLRVDGSSSQGR